MGEDGGAFGSHLRSARRAAGLSQQELAERAGLSVRTIGNMERGASKWPYRDSLHRLADALSLRDEARAEFIGESPDGQLYVNLRGFDPSGTPVTPEEAVRVLLDSLDVPATRRPQTIEAQLGMYRSLLAGRRMLVLLDNARDAAQVRPLLPGAPTCRVIVTSRNQLTGLVATAAARPLLLDVLTDREGGALRRRP